MEFDRLCKEVERRFPEHRPMLEEARLFVFERRQTPKSETSWSMADWQPEEQLVENFRLPFSHIAIDDGRACVVLKEVSAADRKYEVIGLREQPGERVFFHAEVVAFPAGFVRDAGRVGRILDCKELDVFRNSKPMVFAMSGLALDTRTQAKNYALPEYVADGVVRGAGVDCLRLIDQGRVATELIPELEWKVDGLEANMAFLYLHAAVLSALVICEPGRFVVEQTAIDQNKPKGKLIRRSQYRPHYIALSPGEIKKRYLYDEHETESIPRMPHERRGHYRKLTSERYVAKRGQVVWVKPCWIGKTEGVRGKNKYVVRLDL